MLGDHKKATKMFVEIVKKRSFYAGTNYKFILLLGGTNFKLVLISVT